MKTLHRLVVALRLMRDKSLRFTFARAWRTAGRFA